MPFHALLTEGPVNQLLVPTLDSSAEFMLCHHEVDSLTLSLNIFERPPRR